MRLFLPALAIVSLLGCSRFFDFRLEGTVRDASTGQPVSGVEVELDDHHFHGKTAVTDTAGRFSLEFSVMSGDAPMFSKDWTVKLSADGYEDEVVGIGPVAEPGGDDTAYIFLHAYLRPSDGEKGQTHKDVEG